MRTFILLFTTLLFALVSEVSAQPSLPCDEFEHCKFPSGRPTRVEKLLNVPFKGPAADATFKTCIQKCRDYTTNGFYHPGFQTVAWIENDGCYCGVDSIDFVVGNKGQACRASDITCPAK